VRVGRRRHGGKRRREARFVGGRARRQRRLDGDDGAELLQLGRQRSGVVLVEAAAGAELPARGEEP